MRRLPMLLLPLVLTACADSDWQASSGRILDAIQTQQGSGQLSQSDILSGLREALAQGTTTAINQLGTANGFWKDGEVRIPLPAALAKYESTARQFGYGPKLDEFQLTLNRAAEQAKPHPENATPIISCVGPSEPPGDPVAWRHDNRPHTRERIIPLASTKATTPNQVSP